MANPVQATRPLIVGEVLFDQFPNGQRVLGGAPFNVAWNLHGFGMAPIFGSAVGKDEEGREVQTQMEAWGLDTTALQISEKWPTGKVRVELNGGEPRFHILDQQAYDQIRYPTLDSSLADCLLLYVGSLATRNEPSKSTIRRLIRESGLPRFVDINIRQPWFDRESAAELLENAVWIKLNDQELSWIAETPCRTAGDIRIAVETLRRLYGGQQYFITCGAAGAYAIDEVGDSLFAEAPKPETMVDAVGAGDAFVAAAIFGISRDRPVDEILQTAVRFASQVCTIQGATSPDRNHYTRLGDRTWG